MVEFLNSFNKITLVVEYDGKRYCGFQWQLNLPTIQAELEQAIQKLTHESSRVAGASRTDSGVHATGQVVSFRTKSMLQPQTFVRGLNHYLPDDIAVKDACRVSIDFNVRHDALSREYDYRILNDTKRSPLIRDFTYLVANELNIEIMNKACKLLEGKHDFASFATSLGKLKSTVRDIFEARVIKEGNMVTFHVVASSFLPHQVRNTVGLLIKVGLGKVGIEEFCQIMEAKIVGLAGPTVPACGLCLTKVNYPIDLELNI